MLEHPEIGWIERTGYLSWLQENREPDDDFSGDSAYEEAKEMELFGEW